MRELNNYKPTHPRLERRNKIKIRYTRDYVALDNIIRGEKSEKAKDKEKDK